MSEKVDHAYASNPSPPHSSNMVSITDDQKLPNNLPDHRRVLAEQIAAMSPEEYRLAEKKLIRKMDLNLIPWMTLLYLMSFLDRTQFSVASLIFFVSYVAFEVPSNMVLRKFRPSRWIPITMICWAIFQTCMGLVKNYGQLLALRFCLGLFESGLFPGLNFYLTFWYRRDELNKRAAIFFAGAVLAGAFGGIFGYAWSRMAGVGGREGWSWIFIMEGLLTLIVAIASFWMVHDWPHEARFLTPLERELVTVRLKQDQGLAAEGKFSWRMCIKALLDWKVYLMMLMYIGAAEPLYSGSLFLPTIVAGLGKWSVPQSLLLSTPPYVVCFITTLGTAYISDKYKRRSFPLMFWSAVAIIGYTILLSLKVKTHAGPLYFACFLTTAAVGPLIACTISWTGNMWDKRAVAMGMVFSAGNSGGIVASEAYQTKDSPQFRAGHGTALAFCALNFTCAWIMYLMLKRENDRRDRVYGPAPGRDEVQDFESPAYLRKWGLENMTRDQIIELGDDHPAYRYML